MLYTPIAKVLGITSSLSYAVSCIRCSEVRRRIHSRLVSINSHGQIWSVHTHLVFTSVWGLSFGLKIDLSVRDKIDLDT